MAMFRPPKSAVTLVNVAKLKNDLSKYLRLAKEGKEIIVTEHARPIAKVVPFENNPDGIHFIPPTDKDSDAFERLSRQPTVKRSWSSLDLLLEDRKKR